MTARSRLIFTLLLVGAAAIGLRVAVFLVIDGLLPQDGLYVDEKTYAGPLFVQGVDGFSRPPGMFILHLLTGAADKVPVYRIIMSFLSLLPAVALYLSFRKERGIAVLAASALALSPFMLLFGFQLMPVIPAAVLISFALLSASRDRYSLAGFLTGAAALFRPEILLSVPVLLLLSLGGKLRAWGGFALSAAAAVVPVILVNVVSGAGPVIAANGGENLWLGTSWELIQVPPGTEFEELMALGDQDVRGDSMFFDRAIETISARPMEWIGMGFVKTLGFFSFPGPGRNFETGWIMRKTLLVVLLPLTIAALSLALSGLFRGELELWRALALSILIAGLLASFVFFPSARFRTVIVPAVWFLAAGALKDGFSKPVAVGTAAGLILISSLLTYPAMERSGLTSLLAAEHELSSGDLEASMEYLREARERGYHGADYHNIQGALLSMSGSPQEGLREFSRALEIAPRSPTLWKNVAVCLWSNGRFEESLDAAGRAVYLDPRLERELDPILRYGREH